MLRIYDEFLEDDAINALSHTAYRLHVSALVYCSRNLTDGFVTEKALKVVQVILGFPAKKAVAELTKAGLWTPVGAGGGYQIRNYLEFNPDAATVKAEKAKGRERMRKLREKRANCATGDGERDAARAPARDGERALQGVTLPPHTGPSQTFEVLTNSEAVTTNAAHEDADGTAQDHNDDEPDFTYPDLDNLVQFREMP